MVNHSQRVSVRRRGLIRLGATFGCLTALVLYESGPAEAQLSMSVVPIRVEGAIQPGEMQTQLLQVENPSERPLRVSIAVADWFIDPSGAPAFVKRGVLPDFSMSGWIEVNPTEFVVPPAGIQTVRYTVIVPEGTPPGGYRTAMLVQSVPDFEDEPSANLAQLRARIGVIVYNRVGDVTPRVEVVSQEMVADPAAPGKMALRLLLRNPSAMHCRVKGESRIVDAAGDVLQRFMVPDTVVLPQSERAVIVKLERPVTRPVFTVLSTLDVGLEDLLEVETRVGARTAGG